MNQVLFTIQIIAQVAWGVTCFYNSPHHLLLFGLNFILAAAAMASNIAADKGQTIFFSIYFAFLVIPIFFVLYTSISEVFESIALVLQNFGSATSAPLLDNPIESSFLTLKNYVISMLIAPGFRLLSWLIRS